MKDDWFIIIHSLPWLRADDACQDGSSVSAGLFT